MRNVFAEVNKLRHICIFLTHTGMILETFLILKLKKKNEKTFFLWKNNNKSSEKKQRTEKRQICFY
jgi:hypothetical protein